MADIDKSNESTDLIPVYLMHTAQTVFFELSDGTEWRPELLVCPPVYLARPAKGKAKYSVPCVHCGAVCEVHVRRRYRTGIPGLALLLFGILAIIAGAYVFEAEAKNRATDAEASAENLPPVAEPDARAQAVGGVLILGGFLLLGVGVFTLGLMAFPCCSLEGEHKYLHEVVHPRTSSRQKMLTALMTLQDAMTRRAKKQLP